MNTRNGGWLKYILVGLAILGAVGTVSMLVFQPRAGASDAHGELAKDTAVLETKVEALEKRVDKKLDTTVKGIADVLKHLEAEEK